MACDAKGGTKEDRLLICLRFLVENVGYGVSYSWLCHVETRTLQVDVLRFLPRTSGLVSELEDRRREVFCLRRQVCSSEVSYLSSIFFVCGCYFLRGLAALAHPRRRYRVAPCHALHFWRRALLLISLSCYSRYACFRPVPAR